MNEREFKNRTKGLALRVITPVNALPKTQASEAIGKQRLRSATSAGENYRAACRGKSVADVSHKRCIVEEEADEPLYWMEHLIESGMMSSAKLSSLMAETNEIVAMTVAASKTLRAKQFRNPKSKIRNPKSE
jgi:four helix bundle protein